MPQVREISCGKVENLGNVPLPPFSTSKRTALVGQICTRKRRVVLFFATSEGGGGGMMVAIRGLRRFLSSKHQFAPQKKYAACQPGCDVYTQNNKRPIINSHKDDFFHL